MHLINKRLESDYRPAGTVRKHNSVLVSNMGQRTQLGSVYFYVPFYLTGIEKAAEKSILRHEGDERLCRGRVRSVQRLCLASAVLPFTMRVSTDASPVLQRTKPGRVSPPRSSSCSVLCGFLLLTSSLRIALTLRSFRNLFISQLLHTDFFTALTLLSAL